MRLHLLQIDRAQCSRRNLVVMPAPRRPSAVPKGKAAVPVATDGKVGPSTLESKRSLLERLQMSERSLEVRLIWSWSLWCMGGHAANKVPVQRRCCKSHSSL